MHIHDQSFVLSGLDEAGSFTGIASAAGMNRNRYDYSPDAFTASLAEHKARGTMPALLLHHDLTKPVGAWKEITPIATGLKVQGRLTLETADGREAYAHLKAGSLAGLSTGAIHHLEDVSRNRDKPGTIVKKADLYEISLVSVPALPSARVLRVNSIGGARDLEELLREAGLSGRKAKAGASAAWRAINTTDEPDAALVSILTGASQSLARFKKDK
ncbi:HK97 family phage prohead protease [Sphingomonas beigongshangi]|uniref:HK97 family phage prohead protease n=1 Tax=Sphingomonas beigongshangi TaxID=2782540 RepID=UPI00193B46AC|nr:HK97 family phage prohead protease [Sphingomonas beigongshangi]